MCSIYRFPFPSTHQLTHPPTHSSTSNKEEGKKGKERWAEGRELFYILDGAVRIQVRGQRVARLG